MAQKFDREALFGWVQQNATKLEQNLEKGVNTAKKTARKINEKIDANPKTKQIKEKIVSTGEKQAERIKDVRIGHTRIGDLPSAAQKLAERQLYKMINKIKETDPGFEWSQFVPDANQFPVFNAFETLGLPYGTPFDEVKKTYRALMREWHPDKHAGNPEQEKLATKKTQEFTSAYEIISKHYGM